MVGKLRSLIAIFHLKLKLGFTCIDFKSASKAVMMGLIHLDNPVGIYLLEGEILDEVILELSELFISFPFNERIKHGFELVDNAIRDNGVSRGT